MSYNNTLKLKSKQMYGIVKMYQGVSMNINELKGVGITLEKKLNNLGIYTIENLLIDDSEEFA